MLSRDGCSCKKLVLSWQLADYDEATLSIDELYATPLLPGLTITVREAFAS
jgi:hypothetical protein